MMEIKDLAGLSQPLTKLIEVTSKGLGNISKPYLIKKLADAKAYEIERIAKAIDGKKETLSLIEYDDEKIKIICESQEISENSLLVFKDIVERAGKRNFYREVKKQINIENVVAKAAEELTGEQNVSEQPINDDWATRYFNIVEDISSEEMQGLWSKILAGEIKRPNSYSLRTLDILRNITPHEAEIFCKVGAFALTSGDKSILMYEKKFVEDDLGISFTDLLLLRDLGLVFPGELEFSFPPIDKDGVSHLSWGNTIIIVKRKENTPKISLNSVVFTKVGKELLNLVEKPMHKKYLEKTCSKLRINDKIQTYYSDIISIKDDTIHYAALIEVT